MGWMAGSKLLLIVSARNQAAKLPYRAVSAPARQPWELWVTTRPLGTVTDSGRSGVPSRVRL